MSDGLIRARRGERIHVDEYPPGFMEELNKRLNGLPEPREGFLDRAADWVFQNITEGRGFVVIVVIAGTLLSSTIVSQVARLFQ